MTPASALDPGFMTLKLRNGWFQASLSGPRALGLTRELAEALPPASQLHLLRLFRQRAGSMGALERDVIAVLAAGPVPYQAASASLPTFQPDRSQPSVLQPVTVYGLAPGM